MMTQAEINPFRRRLETLMRRLDRDWVQLKAEALQSTGGEASGGLSDVPLHPADLGARDYEEEVTLGLLENEEQLLQEASAALARIEQGTFGICEVCRKSIAEKRLQALPYARYCAPCAKQREGPTAP